MVPSARPLVRPPRTAQHRPGSRHHMSPDRTGRNHDRRRPPILKSLQINPIGTAVADRRHQAETVPKGGSALIVRRGSGTRRLRRGTGSAVSWDASYRAGQATRPAVGPGRLTADWVVPFPLVIEECHELPISSPGQPTEVRVV